MPTTLSLTIVPGIDDSLDKHWQSRWQATQTDAVRIRPASWDEPDLEDWIAAVDAAVTGPDTIIVAHSLGCIAAAAWLAENPGRVRGALLVAPPDRFGPAFPADAPTFRAVEPTVLGTPALVIASSDDPYCALGTARTLANAWGAGFVEVGAAGHINAASKLGAWPAGRAILDEFALSLGGMVR
ncbi:alpha/beta hydrolase [Cryobacterium sp. 1639]|uniref:RBBP9/YdeN family alpha/beta hydrolase n=1 Tax=Cryobacterium inferilacus TaxID=2866629 RepID=UPI001C732856|nr:alpha/beta hydrolase [Cryobacterium sp. 1639]MBX0300794.1 alpha/beta hydrolase [Cryobacterium sp. 1639]